MLRKSLFSEVAEDLLLLSINESSNALNGFEQQVMDTVYRFSMRMVRKHSDFLGLLHDHCATSSSARMLRREIARRTLALLPTSLSPRRAWQSLLLLYYLYAPTVKK